WNHDASLDWHLAADPIRSELQQYVADLGHIYRSTPALWRDDHVPEGFRWIVVDDRQNSVLAFERRAGDEHVIVVLNMTPVPREFYRIGAPSAGAYVRLLSSDDRNYGGSEWETLERVDTEPSPSHGYAQSMLLRLPPLGALLLVPEAQMRRAEWAAAAGVELAPGVTEDDVLAIGAHTVEPPDDS
ncbi:MAG TPA: alpha amylase C-terminal domain-containing protein, partial [Gemmatimonadaceae bacterium]|nr:alpha amylase C-terminal domain-containing protein [Gemmatimonadaceae bacterium]